MERERWCIATVYKSRLLIRVIRSVMHLMSLSHLGLKSTIPYGLLYVFAFDPTNDVFVFSCLLLPVMPIVLFFLSSEISSTFLSPWLASFVHKVRDCRLQMTWGWGFPLCLTSYVDCWTAEVGRSSTFRTWKRKGYPPHKRPDLFNLFWFWLFIQGTLFSRDVDGNSTLIIETSLIVGLSCLLWC